MHVYPGTDGGKQELCLLNS